MSDDSETSKDNGPIDQLRDILLEPVLSRQDKRHAHVMKLLQEISTVLAARIEDLEARVETLSATIETDRRDLAHNIGDAVAGLGQQLRDLAAGAQASGAAMATAAKKAKAATARRRKA